MNQPARLLRAMFLVAIALCGCATGQRAWRRTGFPAADDLLLSGKWEFQLDPKSEGEAARWYETGLASATTIAIPGCWDAQGRGIRGAITTVANADDLTPLPHAVSAYTGDAWYRRTFEIPRRWKNKTVLLHVGGV